MGLMYSKIEMEKLRPGDHIYTWRSSYFYSHHGIYVGDGMVIHLTRGPGLIISSSSQSQQSNDHVVCCNIDDFLCDGQLYRFEYSVKRFVFLMHRAGTCSLAYSSPPEQVLHRASYLLEHGFGNYNLLNKNCEVFALYCKTGFVRVSTNESSAGGQVAALSGVVVAIFVIPYEFLPASLIGSLLVVCGVYCVLKLCSEDGFGFDSRVGAVEKLEHNDWNGLSMMEKRTFLHRGTYMTYTFYVIRYWYWTPENAFLIWLKSFILYLGLNDFISAHLRLHRFKLGEYSAYTIWLLAYLYWRWCSSVSTILVFSRLAVLLEFFITHQPDHRRGLKLKTWIHDTVWVLELWYWTPRFTILQCIRLALLYFSLSGLIISKLLRIKKKKKKKAAEKSMPRVVGLLCMFCNPDRSPSLGVNYCDFIFRITKNITFL